MTRSVIPTSPDTPVVEAANILLKHKFNGLPVVDENNKVIGVLTEYDLILKGTAIHLPTFLQIFQELSVYKKGSEPIREDLRKIFNIKVAEVMNKEPLILNSETSLLEVANAFAQHHKVNPIPIVDATNTLVGIISRHDLLKFLGDPSVHFQNGSTQEVDKSIGQFLNNFQGKFVLVSKYRTHFWLVASILFAVAGFAIAWLWILRISI